MRLGKIISLLASPEFEGLSNESAAILFSTRSLPGPILSEDVVRLLMLLDRWAQIVAASRLPNEEPRTLAALRMVEALARLPAFDLSVPVYAAAIGAGLDGLIAVSLLSSDDKAAVLALADNRHSPAEIHGLGEVSPADVAEARQHV